MSAALIACTRCDYPLDPAAAPHHPSHDITDEEWATFERNDQARAALADAQRDAQLRKATARTKPSRSRGRRR